MSHFKHTHSDTVVVGILMHCAATSVMGVASPEQVITGPSAVPQSMALHAMDVNINCKNQTSIHGIKRHEPETALSVAKK